MAALITWTGHNFADDATLYGSADANFPLTNLQVRGLAAEFRTVAGTTASINCDNRNSYYGPVDTSLLTYVNNTVYDLAVDADGGILLFGAFTSVAGTTPDRVARIAADGTADTAFNANTDALNINGTVQCALYDGSSGWVVGGSFTSVGGVTYNRLARLNPDGTHEASFNPNVNNTVYAVARYPTFGFLIGGSFTTVGGTARNRLARLNSSGTLNTSLNHTFTGTSEVRAIAPQPDGTILIGGRWTAVSGHSSVGIAKLKNDLFNEVDTSFTQTVGTSGTVYAIAVQPDGKIIIAGQFNSVGGTTRVNIARLHPDGALDTGFVPPALTGIVQTVALQPDGKILVGGSFTNRLARLNPDGSLDTSFNVSTNNVVHSIRMHGDEAYIGGAFVQVDGQAMTRVARLRPIDQPGLIRFIALLGMRAELGTIKVSWRMASAPNWTALFTERVHAKTESMGWLLDTPLPGNAIVQIEYASSITGVFSLGRLWVGDALVLPDGIDAGWSMTFRDSGSLDATDGQQWVQSPGVITRVMTIPLEGARDTETHWGFADGSEAISNRMSLHALQLEAGVTGEVIAVARTSTATWVNRTMVYGHIDSPWAIGHSAGPYWGGSLTVVEER
ncbi:MAG: hypothetical protein WDA70_03600 [Lysobacteraceae bacterium]